MESINFWMIRFQRREWDPGPLMHTKFVSWSITHTFKESPKNFLVWFQLFISPLGCEESSHKWIFFIFEGNLQGNFECKKMEIINLGRLVFEDVNGPQGHLCSLNFFQKSWHIHLKSLQKNCWSDPNRLKHLLGVKNPATNGFFSFLKEIYKGILSVKKWRL